MHFFYIDEAGCTGSDLSNTEQPIFIIGGLSVTDEAWRKTTDAVQSILTAFFSGKLPDKFELHAHQLVNGEGPFVGKSQAARNKLALDLLDLLAERKHATHFVAIDKPRLSAAYKGKEHAIIDCGVPYLLGFNYLISYIERYVKDHLGTTARGMIILDEKKNYQGDIDNLTRYRRYDVPQVRQLKRLVEFSYPIDSVRHPLIQISDLVIYVTKKFLECEGGYRKDWPNEAKLFFASCYEKVHERTQRTTLIDIAGQEEQAGHALLVASQATHQKEWKKRYGVQSK